ncbi:Fc.00g008310.m01.CDS01 [Cosmosporella sp. VM-42]
MAPPYTNKATVNELAADYASIIKGKTILTTGVTPGGLGAVFVEAIAASNPALLILAGRTACKVQATADAITSKYPDVRTRMLILDLSSMKQVREAAKEVKSWADVPRIDVLVNNAAVMAIDYKATVEGFETQFATGHLGHFLFTNLIIDKLLASGSPRVVSVSSDGHRLSAIRWADPHWGNGETYSKWHAYGQTKTANMLLAVSLAEKLGKRGLRAYSLHPGVIISTGLGNHLDPSESGDFADLTKADRAMGNIEGWKGFDFVPSEVGAATHAFAAFDPSLEDHNGAYLLESRLADPYRDTVKPWATSSIEADRLWKLSEELLGQKFSY